MLIGDSLVRHLDSPASGTGHCGLRGRYWATAGHASGVTRTSCFSPPTVLAAARSCSLSPPLNFQLNVRPTSLPTGAFPFGRARAVSSRTTASSSAPKLSHVAYELLHVRKISTSSYHPSDDGDVERVSHTMVANERQDYRNAQIPRVNFTYNN